MSASLCGTRFLGVREPGWHKLGTVIEVPIPVREAIKVANINYLYHDAPIGYTLPTGEFVQTDDRKVVLREPLHDDPHWRRLGIVANSYHYLQNDELAAGLDVITEKTGWKLETVGALENGGTVFMTLDLGQRSVKGDEYREFFIVSDGKASGRALTVSCAPVRVVCMNTLMASDAAASLSIKIAHDHQVGSEYEFWLDFIADMERARNETFAQLERMAARKVTEAEADAIFAAAFPYPAKNQRARMAETIESPSPELLARLESGVKAYEADVMWAEKHRETAKELFERFNEGNEQGGQMPKVVLKKVARTAYAALQATTELVDWGGQAKDTTAAQSAIFGYKAGIKKRAWGAALALAEGETLTASDFVESITAQEPELVLA